MAGSPVWWCAAVCLGCAGLPPLGPLDPEAAHDLEARCAAARPAPPFRAVHAIEARLPDGERADFVGVTAVEAQGGGFRSLLLTLEGLVLLDLERRDGEVTVLRALPPTDRPGFAEGLAGDVALLLVTPSEPPRLGLLPDGAAACRWTGSEGEVVDLVPSADGGWRAVRYGAGGEARGEAQGSGGGSPGRAPRLRLETPGPVGYGLALELLEFEEGAAGAGAPP